MKSMIKRQVTLMCIVYFLLVLHPRRERKLKLLKPTNEISPPTWVSAHPYGRLGNQLFIAASSHGIAKRRKSKLCIRFEDWADEQIFKTVIWPVRECPNGIKFETIGENQKYAAHVSDLESSHLTKSVMLNGYLQSHLYWKNLTLPFRLKDTNWAQAWIQQRKIKVGIHIRRGDYLTSPDHIGKTPPLRYYADALSRINPAASSVLICSDDPDWAESQPLFRGMHVSRGFSAGQDMAILSQCDDLIISTGTFGWWAGFFKTEGRVFYYSKPDEDDANGRFVHSDYYPSSWIALNANIKNK